MLQKQPGINAVLTARDVEITTGIVLGPTEIEGNIRNEHDNKIVQEAQQINFLQFDNHPRHLYTAHQPTPPPHYGRGTYTGPNKPFQSRQELRFEPNAPAPVETFGTSGHSVPGPTIQL